MKDNFVRLAPAECPVCHRMNDSASCMSDANAIRPKPGSYAMCLRCGALLVYTRTMRLRMMTEREFVKAPNETRELWARMARSRKAVMDNVEDKPSVQ